MVLLGRQDGFGLVSHKLEDIFNLGLEHAGQGGDLSLDGGGQRLDVVFNVAGERLQLLLELLNHGLELGSALLKVSATKQTKENALIKSIQMYRRIDNLSSQLR